jgi:hypothetical protein
MSTRALIVLGVVAGSLLVATGLASGKPTSRHQSQAQGQLENRALFAVLTGRKEVDENGRRGAGDSDGRGSFTATIDGRRLCFGITVKNLDEPVAAHIHRGRSNQNGPVVVPLTQPSSGDPGASSGCVTVEAALAGALLRQPHRYYANVHTGRYPAGAVRGQLFRRTN